MKLIAVTQRVISLPKLKEKRDSLDQRWYNLLLACGYLPYLVPNQSTLLPSIFQLPIEGVILTGGDSLTEEISEREQVERTFLEYAITHALPIVGICRGMQLILRYFGSSLEKVEGHVGKLQQIQFKKKAVLVNSYHHFGAFQVHSPLEVVARSKDGVVKAVAHQSLPVRGIMWHPEREPVLSSFNIDLLRDWLTK